MIGNKIQPYTYSLKTAMIGGRMFCSNKFYFYLTPPENALSIENLQTHIRVQFDTAVLPEAYRKILRIGVQNALDGLEYSTHKRSIELNLAADVNGLIDLQVDLTSLINKDNVEFWPGTAADYPNATNFIFVEVPIEIYNYYVGPSYDPIGEVELWKADALFTIRAIR
jgi:hypothetical protein